MNQENEKPKNRKMSVKTILSVILILVLIPVTVILGMGFGGEKKYYLTSLIVIVETFAAFGLMFESRKPQAREIVVISVLCAIAVAGRIAFFMLPEFKPVVAIVIISGVCFGGETGFLVGAVTAFASNFFFGQGPWTPWQMFAFGIIGFLAGVLSGKKLLSKKRISLSIFGFLTTLIIYGGIMNTASVLMMTKTPSWAMICTAIAMGLPVDLVHAVSTAVFLWFISVPMIEKTDRIKLKYGIIKK